MDELTRGIHKNLDGLIIVDGGSTDGTKEINTAKNTPTAHDEF